ncbi:MAG TPA: methylmalonyl-CoA mutase family protein, partial [Ureibacillus sp.]|nr:methylmalonyl-CoA mutase family protein [Ureibacillus sp.]
IGQGDAEITNYTDLSMYVMTSEFGAPTQLEKIDMIDYADLIAINKFERKGSEDALRQVQKQYQRSHELWNANLDSMPVYGTIASQFNDKGTNSLFAALIAKINEKCGLNWETSYDQFIKTQKQNVIIPNDRRYYLREIVDTVRNYHKKATQQVELASKLYQLEGSIVTIQEKTPNDALISSLQSLADGIKNELTEESKQILSNWGKLKESYSGDELVTKIRDKEIRTLLKTTSLSGTKIPKVALPKFKDYGEILRWVYAENVPGQFPYTAGVFPFKRQGEDPKRQFAGEGTPERTNKRFHYLSKDDDAKRLSTAFDSVTLYGEDPDIRPDIYGKVGESGVSVCTLDDMKKLYAGFDLCAPSTSVSMTINGPAPIILAMFMNTAIDQQVQQLEAELGRQLTIQEFTDVREKTLQVVRGTVQADILKEDQGQNTCIFSTEFALRMMGDIQQYFIDQKVRNYYSVSISGYHIAEAGANPISQLAFTLANGFTYVEYYLSRGMHIDDFAPNLSFFFSNGLDPEYTVIGRVARRIWSIVMRDKYGANERSQKLKYHIQTSGRSLHAQEIDFNDIRTTLQALMALQDNCNSLHTNAYDEAITTPTEESVRRAMAIQMIITKELGLSKNENPLQGSFIIEELTDLVEQAVL